MTGLFFPGNATNHILSLRPSLPGKCQHFAPSRVTEAIYITLSQTDAAWWKWDFSIDSETQYHITKYCKTDCFSITVTFKNSKEIVLCISTVSSIFQLCGWL